MSLTAARDLIRASNTATSTVPPTTAPPAAEFTTGSLDIVAVEGSRIRVQGWAHVRRNAIVTRNGEWVPNSPMSSDPLFGLVFLNKWVLPNNVTRTDVPPAGARKVLRAFDTYIDTDTRSSDRICVTDVSGPVAVSPRLLSPLTATQLTTSVCVEVANPSPRLLQPSFGLMNIESITVTGDVAVVSGWALRTHRDSGIDGEIALDLLNSDWEEIPITTTISRPDVAAAYPGTGELHGFVAMVPLPPQCPCTVRARYPDSYAFEDYELGDSSLGPGTIGGNLYLPTITVNR